MVLPEGFALPPVWYLAPIVAVLLGSAWLLWTLRPPVTDRTVLAVVPWMVAGGAGHAMYIVGALPAALEPFFGVPAVYLSLGALGGMAWVAAELVTSTRTDHDAAAYLFVAGVVAAAVAVSALAWWGLSTGALSLWWPAVGLLIAIVLTLAAWMALDRFAAPTAAVAGWTGIVVVFGHALDGVSTAIGVDILGAGERTPLSDAIIQFGASLPTASLLGDAWVFVVVKLALAVGILVLFREYLEEEPSRARLLLAVVAAVGLGPGVHNLLLFALP